MENLQDVWEFILSAFGDVKGNITFIAVAVIAALIMARFNRIIIFTIEKD